MSTKVNTRAPNVLTMAGPYGYKSKNLEWQRESSISQRLPCCFFLLAFVHSQLPFLADMIDHGEHPQEGVLEAGGPPPHLRVLLCEHG